MLLVQRSFDAVVVYTPTLGDCLTHPFAIVSSRSIVQKLDHQYLPPVCPRCLRTPHAHLVRVLVVNVRGKVLAVAVCRNPSQHFRVALALRQRLLLHRRGVKLEPALFDFPPFPFDCKFPLQFNCNWLLYNSVGFSWSSLPSPPAAHKAKVMNPLPTVTRSHLLVL